MTIRLRNAFGAKLQDRIISEGPLFWPKDGLRFPHYPYLLYNSQPDKRQRIGAHHETQHIQYIYHLRYNKHPCFWGSEGPLKVPFTPVPSAKRHSAPPS